MSRKTTKKQLFKEAGDLVKETISRHGEEYFLTGKGGFVNKNGQGVSSYEVLRDLAGMRSALVELQIFFQMNQQKGE